MALAPGWLQWLSYLLWPLVVLSIILVFSYFFSTIANWIAERSALTGRASRLRRS
ncbi:CysZ domain protein, partial [Candidatus Erwinia dacicola]